MVNDKLLTINLDDEISKNILRFAICQVKHPKLQRGFGAKGEPIFTWLEDINDRYNKIIKILNKLSEMNVDFVIFPEYSIHYDHVEKIKNNYANKFKIIVAGSDQVRDSSDEHFRKHASQVILNDTIYRIFKDCLSEDEIGIVKKAEATDPSILKIVGQYKDNDGELKNFNVYVFICRDYLALKNLGMLSDTTPGIVIIAMVSEMLEDFYYASRLVVGHNKAVLLCNSSKNIHDKWIGLSSVIGSSKYAKDDRYWRVCFIPYDVPEGILIVDINLDQILRPTPTPIAGGFTIYCEPYKLEYDDKGNISLQPIPRERERIERVGAKAAIINPYVFDMFDRRLRIILAKSSQYLKALDEFKSKSHRLTIDAFTCLGDHDFIILTFADETVINEDELRRYYLDDIKEFRVSKIFKFYTFRLEDDQFKMEIRPSILQELLSNCKNVLDLIRGFKDDEKEKKESYERLKRDNILLGDIEPELFEQNERFMCFIRIEEGSYELFERNVIPDILENFDRNIISMFRIEGGVPGFQFNYVLDLLGFLRDVDEIVIV